MRLNRNSLLFIALLVVIIIIAMIFLRDSEDSDTPDVEATAETIQIFPGLSVANITSLTISEIQEVGDTRPTPIPGNATLEAPTPLPEGVEPEMTTAIVSLSKDAETSTWIRNAESTLTIDGTIDSTRLSESIANLLGLQSNRQFTPSDASYEQYGLSEARFDINFVAEAESYRLRIGNRTVGENGYYAFLNNDSETIYVINGASTLQNGILNLTTSVPLEAIPTATAAPVLNAQVPFAEFVLTNSGAFRFSKNDTGDVIEISRNEDNTAWVYTENGEELNIQQETLNIILNSFASISGVDETSVSELATLGLDTPVYDFQARMVDGRLYKLQIGDADPAGTVFYSLVDDFDSVVLIDADSLGLILSLFENPPVIVPEETPEATEAVEATEESE